MLQQEQTPQNANEDLDSTVKDLLPDLRRNASDDRERRIQEQLLGAQKTFGRHVLTARVDPEGTVHIEAHLPREGEAPNMSVVREDHGSEPDDEALLSGQSWREYAEEATRGVPEAIYQRDRYIQDDAELFAEGLGGGRLSQAVGGAIKKRGNDIVEVARKVQAGQERGLTAEEVARAQRDLFMLEQAAVLAFGVRDGYEGIVASSAYLQPIEYKKTGSGKHRFTYEIVVETFWYEGDHEDMTLDERNNNWPDGVPYSGKLTIEIDPERRIDLDLRPDQASARQYHATEDVVQRGEKLVSHAFEGLSLRIDLDPKSPAGLAVDMGRSEYQSDVFIRDADLMGKVMSVADPEAGSHTYEGFTKDMLPDFEPMAEQLAVKLALGFSEHEVGVRARRARDELDARRQQGKPVTDYDLHLQEAVDHHNLQRKNQDDRHVDDDRPRYTRGY